MKIIYAGVTPYTCPLFDFDEQFSHYAAHEDAECLFLPDSPLKLPWQLKDILKKCDPTEKVVVHTSSAFGVVAVSEAVAFGAKVSPYVVYMPKDTDDIKEFRRYGKYASQVSATILTNDAQMQLAASTWEGSPRLELLLPPALAPTDGGAAAPEGLSFLYQGEITRYCRLDAVIKVLAANGDMTLSVDGTGKGRWAMPMVRLSRTLDTESRIKWNSNERDGIVESVNSGTFVTVFEPRDPWQQVVMASYMMQGAIVIALDCDASRQLIKPGVTGILLEAFDEAQLSKAVALIGAQRAAISAAAREYAASTLTLNTFFDHLMSIYRSL